MLQRELCSRKRINTRIDIREWDLHPHMTERKIYLRWQMRLGRCRAIDIVAAANLAGKWATYAARSHSSIQWCVCGPSYPVWWDRPVDCQGALFLLNVSVIQQTVGYGGKRWGWYHRCQQQRRVVQRLLRYPIGGGKKKRSRESSASMRSPSCRYTVTKDGKDRPSLASRSLQEPKGLCGVSELQNRRQQHISSNGAFLLYLFFSRILLEVDASGKRMKKDQLLALR